VVEQPGPNGTHDEDPPPKAHQPGDVVRGYVLTSNFEWARVVDDSSTAARASASTGTKRGRSRAEEAKERTQSAVIGSVALGLLIIVVSLLIYLHAKSDYDMYNTVSSIDAWTAAANGTTVQPGPTPVAYYWAAAGGLLGLGLLAYAARRYWWGPLTTRGRGLHADQK